MKLPVIKFSRQSGVLLTMKREPGEGETEACDEEYIDHNGSTDAFDEGALERAREL